MPPIPKHPSARARRNKVAGARTLHAVENPEIPELPELDEFEWHEMTIWWWNDIHSSAMSPEWEQSDIHGLFMLAALVDQFWAQPSPALAGEIRLQSQRFGLSPIDRRRLQWEIEQGEKADASTRERRNQAGPKAAEPTRTDPRATTKARTTRAPRASAAG